MSVGMMIHLLARMRAVPFALLCWTGIARSVAAVRGARILTVHGTPRRQAAELQRQLQYIRREFRVVPLPLLVERLEDPKANVDDMVALTFDDGLRSNLDVAYPLLRSLGLPATFFVCPGLIEQGRWLWTHEARCRLRWMEPDDRERIACALGAPADVDAFVEWMKHLEIGARQAVEERVREATPEFVRSWSDHDDFDLANWDELRQLDAELITIGCHTMTHPILPSMGPEALEFEIAESRRLLEERLQRKADLFAYPNSDHNAEVRALVRANYRAAVSCGRQSIVPGVDLHLLPRLDLPRGALRLALTMHRAEPQFAL